MAWLYVIGDGAGRTGGGIVERRAALLYSGVAQDEGARLGEMVVRRYIIVAKAATDKQVACTSCVALKGEIL
jgi:hypothetical protein